MEWVSGYGFHPQTHVFVGWVMMVFLASWLGTRERS